MRANRKFRTFNPPRVLLWMRRGPPIARRQKLWTVRTRRKFPTKGPYEGYLRGKFVQRISGHVRFPRYRPGRHFDRSPEDNYE